jgi:hypothetical protein
MDSLTALQATGWESAPPDTIQALLTHYIESWRERDDNLQAVLIATRAYVEKHDKDNEEPTLRHLINLMEDMLSSTETETTLKIIAKRAGELLEARHG